MANRSVNKFTSLLYSISKTSSLVNHKWHIPCSILIRSIGICTVEEHDKGEITRSQFLLTSLLTLIILVVVCNFSEGPWLATQ